MKFVDGPASALRTYDDMSKVETRGSLLPDPAPEHGRKQVQLPHGEYLILSTSHYSYEGEDDIRALYVKDGQITVYTGRSPRNCFTDDEWVGFTVTDATGSYDWYLSDEPVTMYAGSIVGFEPRLRRALKRNYEITDPRPVVDFVNAVVRALNISDKAILYITHHM